jgi:hypothetical protein
MLSGIDRLREVETIAVAVSSMLYGTLLALSLFRGERSIDIVHRLVCADRRTVAARCLFAVHAPFDNRLADECAPRHVG